MSELFHFLKEPVWWISVFGVGIAINILSVYVHKWAGFGFRSLLLKLFHLKEADDKRVARDAALVSGSDIVRAAFISRQIAASMRTILALLICITLLSVIANTSPTGDTYVSLFIVIVCMCAAVLNVIRAQYCQLVIQAAADQLQKNQKK